MRLIATVALLTLLAACTAENPASMTATPSTSPPAPPKLALLVVPDVEDADLRAGYQALKGAGFRVTWGGRLLRAQSLLRIVSRYARGVGPKPRYSWITHTRPRPGAELKAGDNVSIVNVRCPDGYRGPCNPRIEARPPRPEDTTRRVLADCFEGSVRPRKMILRVPTTAFALVASFGRVGADSVRLGAGCS